jgi:hypothetical protein
MVFLRLFQAYFDRKKCRISTSFAEICRMQIQRIEFLIQRGEIIEKRNGKDG